MPLTFIPVPRVTCGNDRHSTPARLEERPVTERAFDFIPVNNRAAKPRSRGLTEIRGPYYSVMGPRYLEDVLETMHPYVDGLKFAGGSFALMPAAALRRLIELAHRYGVYVSTGGWIERVMTYGPQAVGRYIDEARDFGFDMIELSVGFISLPADDLLRLVERVRRVGLKAKPELGIQFGAGGATASAELAAEGTRGAGWVISRAKACLSAGAAIIMIESEGITESVTEWRTDVVAQIIEALGIERVMFEAADPAVFEWYVKNYGAEVNLFVDHSQIVQLECLRAGIWGTKSTWGRIASYPGE
jgi:phosphosulfolactate synthase (CoM biosynthesis protein A)